MLSLAPQVRISSLSAFLPCADSVAVRLAPAGAWQASPNRKRSAPDDPESDPHAAMREARLKMFDGQAASGD